MKAFLSIITVILALLLVFLFGYFWGQTAKNMDDNTVGASLSILFKIIIPLFMVLVSGLIGYVIGNFKTFREQKHKTYVESLPPILTMAYNRKQVSENTFNEALCKLWLCSNKKIARQLEKAVRIIVKSVQINFLQRLHPKEFNHIYLQLIKKYEDSSTNKGTA